MVTYVFRFIFSRCDAHEVSRDTKAIPVYPDSQKMLLLTSIMSKFCAGLDFVQRMPRQA